MEKEIYFLILLLGILILINYPFLDSQLEEYLNEEREIGIVKRIIDGDTIIMENITIRLLGINTPEKGEKYFTEAKEFLEEQILNKTISLKFGKSREDRYGRTLAYVFLGEKNVNLEIIQKGFANPYFPSGKDKDSLLFYDSWENCDLNLCEKSRDQCANCIKINKFDYLSEKIVLENTCYFDCDLTNWEIKDEGRKKFIFPNFVLKEKQKVSIVVNTEGDFIWEEENYVWTKSGDTLFLRDSENFLVLFQNY
ncbi:hypothetical protein HOD88_01705 [archaeon]|jgi:micrococcal nuclease|nr:hypothetical protein [archaeon]